MLPVESSGSMRYFQLILTAAVIPLLLTATVFAAPVNGGLTGVFSSLANSAMTNNALDGMNTGSVVQTAAAASGKTHDITISAERLDNGLLAYKLVSYKITDSNNKKTDIAKNYPTIATIPGPTIVLT